MVVLWLYYGSMNNTDKNNASEILKRLNEGRITYEEAKTFCQEYIDKINIKGAEIAKKYRRTFYPIGFSAFRNKFKNLQF